MECRGVDVFIVHKGLPSELPRKHAGFELESVSNRGAQYSLDSSPNFLLVDWHQCRYVSKVSASDEEITQLLQSIGKVYVWEKAQKLFVNTKGEPLYSKVHES